MSNSAVSNRTGIAAAAAALVGVLLPWVSTPLLSRSGISTADGKVVAVLAVLALVAGLVAVRPRRAGAAYLVCGGLGAATALYDLIHLGGSVPPGLAAMISPGAGLYLDLAALTALAITGILLIARRA